jgi:trimethylguanosine synthase
LDDESWLTGTPEAVAEHVASKIKCDTVLNGYCGAGGDAIKLSSTCSRVIASDACRAKLRCLENNAKIYCVENIEMINEDFLKLEGIEPDVVYLALPFGSSESLIYNSI